MDWNNDGKVDFQDYGMFESGNSDSGGVDDAGCLSWILVGLVVLQIFKWLVELFG